MYTNSSDMLLHSYKNMYQGERIFLIGNGPSLLKTPLDALQSEYTFAMNRIALLYDKVSWRPSFFTCPTSNVRRKDWRRDIMESISLGIPSFVWQDLKEYFQPLDNIIFINCTHGDVVAEEVPEEFWSYDITKRVCKFGTSMLVALQIAAYMGFNPIYLLGCDMGFQEDRSHRKTWHLRKILSWINRKYRDPNHFDPNYGTPGCEAEVLNQNMLAAHRLALYSTRKIGVNIYNATIGGYLEVYPRVQLSAVLKS